MDNSLATKDDIMMIIEKINSAKIDTETQIKIAKEQTVSSFKEELTAVQSTLHDLRVENESLRNDVNILKEISERQKDEIKDLKGVTKMQRDTLLELQQRSRIDSLKIYGLREEGGVGGESAELTGKVVRDFFYRKLGVDVRSSDISIAHRLQASDRGNRHRTVIVKFTRRTVKTDILKARRKLKGTAVTIVEDLSSTNMRLFYTMRDLVGKKNAWTWDGKVLVKIGDVTKRVTVDNEAEIIREVGEYENFPRGQGHRDSGNREGHPPQSRESPHRDRIRRMSQDSRGGSPARGRSPDRRPTGASAPQYSEAAARADRRRSTSRSSDTYYPARDRSDSRGRDRSRERSRQSGEKGREGGRNRSPVFGGEKRNIRGRRGQNLRGFGRGRGIPQ